ncbi:MAG: hypothetical protein MK100_01280 [Phycisphaerales bacterium]|nr:hypothetical protein [Phycisphaerales bacterium]
MITEARRSVIRIGSNYARLLATLVFGIIVVPLLVGWLGADALGLFLFLVSQAGIASLFEEVIRTSLIRELAAAWHGERDFREACDAAALVSIVVIILALAAFALLIWIMGFLIPDPYLDAARLTLVFEAAFTIVNVACTPAVNMYVVREEFILQNLLTMIRRADFLIAVLLCSWIWPQTDPGTGLIVFAAFATGYRSLIIAAGAGWMIKRDTRLLGRPWKATKPALKAVMSTFGWNTGVIVATNLHDRAGAFVANIWFGLFGNTVFGLATRLVGYIRMVTMGMTAGVDAVGARLASAKDSTGSLQNMIRNVSKMHAIMAWPAAVTAFVLADELIRLWIGVHLDNPSEYVDITAMLVRVAALGLAARAISDGWILLLYGAGYVNRYAKILFVGGILDPILAIALVLMLPALGDEGVSWNNISGPCWAITVTYVAFHGVLLPMRGAKILQIPLSTFIGPIIGPILLALVISPILLWPQWIPVFRASEEAWGLLDLMLAIGSYALVYVTLASFLLLSKDERRRLFQAIPLPARSQ